MHTDDIFVFLNKLEYDKWYELKPIHKRLLELNVGCNEDFLKFVSFLIVRGDSFYIDTQTMKIKRLRIYGK